MPYQNLFHLKFQNQRDMTKTMLRFQEHYESPNKEFTKRGFTLEEYKEWYKKSQKKDQFTYYTDWSGFNLPCYVLNTFYNGEFKRLSQDEQDVLNCFYPIHKAGVKFYIIATYDESDLAHEKAHGLYYLEPEYRKAVKRIISSKKKQLTEFIKELKTMGYSDELIDDELHAYIGQDYGWMLSGDSIPAGKEKFYLDIHESLMRQYSKYIKS